MSLRMWLAILAGLQLVAGGLAGLGWVPLWAVGAATLLVGGLTAGTARYLQPARPALPPALLAEQLYRAYGDRVAWRNYAGDPMPAWEDLHERTQAAWIAAAKVATIT